ncbi:DUF5677 domain-containing protein [Aliifodinibius sp. S!AR15-10]|uniref:DUF5677 domain-containing protein n=1 Tax=Aliifodinibius sp. S!AR15-10 TaxID=2950437 RepID=UPI00285E4A29|nr:DUF5677 domain-containing protein [Aliifodinibius sp. S!AR15-10]MDR8392085.1 DUF5677 domain-containing protein [Aliifodinibius sp. S!AR15-10]
MGTEPVEEILPGNWGKGSNLLELLKDFENLMNECVNYGTHIYKWINVSFENEKDYPIAIILLVRHLLEVSLSIANLTRDSLIDPAKIQLRSLFETFLLIKYLTEKDFKKRSYAYLTTHYIKRKKLHEKFNPKTEVGKQFKSEMQGTILKDLKVHEEFDLDQASKNLEHLLNKREGFKEAYQEYNRIKKEYGKTHSSMTFFSLYSEIMNLESLSKDLNLHEHYELIFRDASKKVHASDVITGYLSSDSSGQNYIRSLKDPTDAQYVTFFTILYLKITFELLIKKFRQDKSVHYMVWFKENIETKFNQLAEEELISIDV